MALRLLTLICEYGHRREVRKPLQPNLVAAVAQASECHWCDPAALDEICPSCLIPFSVMPCHAQGLCFACYVAKMRWERSLRSLAVPTRTS